MYSDIEDRAIRDDARAGETARVCAERLGRTRNSVISRAFRIGVHFKQRNGSWPPACAPVVGVTLPRVGWLRHTQQLAAE